MTKLPDKPLPPGTKVLFRHVYGEDNPWFGMNGMICTVYHDNPDGGTMLISERPLDDSGVWPRRNFQMIDNWELDAKQYDDVMLAMDTLSSLSI